MAECDRVEDSTHRTQPERDALYILECLLPYLQSQVIEAGLIRKWLAKYPFGGSGASLDRKREIIMKIFRGASSYEDREFGFAMKNILTYLIGFDGTREEMMKCGLIDAVIRNDFGRHPRPSSQVEVWNRIPEDPVETNGGLSAETRDILNDGMTDMDWIQHVPNVPNNTTDGTVMPAGNRRREESIEERALRRRRREAVVVGRNGQPIQNEDIIQREAGMVNEEGEGRDALEPLESVREAESEGERGWWALLSRLRPNGLAPG